MHYRNGRPAKNGDKVVVHTGGGIKVGILHSAVAGNDHCNGRIAPLDDTNPWINLKETLHYDDFAAAHGDLDKVPDTSTPSTASDASAGDPPAQA